MWAGSASSPPTPAPRCGRPTSCSSPYGATYTPERVVTHPGDRLIIGAGVSAGIDLALTLAAELASPVHAQAYQLGLEYDPRPPYDAGSLAKAPAEAKALLGVVDG